MSWLTEAARRAQMTGAEQLEIPANTPPLEAWDAASRALGVTPAALAARIAPVLGIKVANTDIVETAAVRLLPEKLARRYHVFPMREDDRTFTVATSNPTDLEAEQAIGFATGRRAIFELGTPLQLVEAINAGYSPDRAVEKLLENVDAQIADVVRVVEEANPEHVAEKELASGPVVKLTSMIVRDAISVNASDIHIEPGPKGGVVRFRIDGVLRAHMHLPLGAVSRIVSRIKVLAKLDIADRSRPQDGRARVSVMDKMYDLRVSTVPTRDSEKAVIRVLRPDSARTMTDTGLLPRDLALVRHLINFREGIVLVTGPTGSGKTTTLYGALREVAARNVNITTVEDPIEYELPSITQIQVEPKRNVTFASALRAILRQDPDVIFIGEIRDDETAEVAAQAALTGHLVLASLHTNDAISAVTRLHDLGLPRATIAAALRGSIAQRLIRKVCMDCRIVIEGALTDEEQRLANAFGQDPVVRAVGCPACGGAGFRGRLPLVEVAMVTPALAEAITNGGSAATMQRVAVSGGMRSLRDAALERVALGETTLQEVERVIGEVVEESGEQRPPRQPSPTPAGEDESWPLVLVADDDAVLRKVATKLLRSGGFRVQTVTDGQEALDRLNSVNDVALVISDLHMPKMGGVDLLASIRESPLLASTPVIILTSDDDHGQEVRLIDAGADDYLRKPIDSVRMLSRVRAALRRAHA